jgi:peroxiredoxin (alkyl hydroperoxide reductase subunit C)
MVKIGEKIADLEFEVFHNNDIKRINLSDYRGKWIVLAFYPADFTFVCPTELAELADNYEKFKEIGAEIISISTDTAYVHKAWHDQSPMIKKVTYPMGADPTHSICKEFGTFLEHDGCSFRATFIIDPDGILKSMEVHDNSIGRSANEILRKLQAANYVRENPAQVCPASWQPGDETLKPGLDLVGKL